VICLNILVYYPGRKEEHKNKDDRDKEYCHTDIISKEYTKEVVQTRESYS